MLNPKKPKECVKQTAEALGTDENLVQDIVDFYWKEVRKALSDLRGPRVEVANFGTFRIKSWKLQEAKDDYQKVLAKHNPEKMTFQRHAVRAEVEQRMEQISKMQKMVEDDRCRKQQIKEKRNAEESRRNTQTPEADS